MKKVIKDAVKKGKSTLSAVMKKKALSVVKKKKSPNTVVPKDRPTQLVKVCDLPGVPKAVAAKHEGAAFHTRQNIASEDRKGSSHGDNYILKKMFKDRPYNSLWKKHCGQSAGDLFMKGRRVLDLGANIGAFSVQAAFGGCHVTALEPDGETFRVLQKNAKENEEQYTPVSGRITCVQGAVAHRTKHQTGFSSKLYLYPKVAKPLVSKLGSLKYRPDRPNRSSLLLDSVNNCEDTRFLEEVKTCYSLKDAIAKFKPDLVKADIEGAELDVVLHSFAEDRRALLKTSVQELLVYYHLDKHPKLAKFDAFLTKLETLFTTVALESCPSLDPRGWVRDWRKESRKNAMLEPRTDGLGFASAKKDVLVYCRR